MDQQRIQHLLYRYNTGEADADEVKEIENLIERGNIELEEIQSLKKMNYLIGGIETPDPSLALDDRFRKMLKEENERSQKTWWPGIFNVTEWGPRLAFASVSLIVGLTAGYFLWSPDKNDEQIVQMGKEISSMREMMMLSLLEKESATDRLKAVNLTQDMDQVSKAVTSALLETLNNDENVNVRLAALDALRPYSKDGQIREALVRSITEQKSPLVQVALAELMVALQEKGAIDAFSKILQDTETPSDIKKKIKESIQEI
jgi:hypothetical protein